MPPEKKRRQAQQKYNYSKHNHDTTSPRHWFRGSLVLPLPPPPADEISRHSRTTHDAAGGQNQGAGGRSHRARPCHSGDVSRSPPTPGRDGGTAGRGRKPGRAAKARRARLFSFYLPHVRLIPQQRWNHCGAATAQMLVGAASEGSYPEQSSVWEMIQTANVEHPECPDAPPLWWTDPEGLRQTLSYCLPREAPWTTWTSACSEEAMQHLLRTMTLSRQPVATVTDNGNHWVVVVAFVADRDPRRGRARVYSLVVFDPLPTRRGRVTVYAGKQSDSAQGDRPRWGSDWTPNTIGLEWKDRYIIVQSPVESSGPALRG
jgi:hypothetical protein